jgi:cobaltochelatase CobS
VSDHDDHDHGDGKIACAICGERVHVMKLHLQEAHPKVTLEAYKVKFPDAPVLSPTALAKLEEARRKTASAPAPTGIPTDIETGQGALHEVFRLGTVKAAMNARTGAPLPITVYRAPPALRHFVPEVDPAYIFPIDLLKTGVMALEMRMPALFWGHAGTGKSSMWEQIHANIGKPIIRIQHTRNTEESHVVGQWVVRDGRTVFELGPLAFAMKFGLTYLADEYDFAMPSVLSVYQPVMEGKPMVIKEADEANRIIRPHPLFRFVATGNTNGTGDETGLYQGTLLQNAANYERFAVVEEVRYMDRKTETQVVAAQAQLSKEIAEKLVNFANQCREAYAQQKLGVPPSPRAMIHAGIIGRLRGDMTAGLRLAYINRLPRVDQEAANEVLRRIVF